MAPFILLSGARIYFEEDSAGSLTLTPPVRFDQGLPHKTCTQEKTSRISPLCVQGLTCPAESVLNPKLVKQGSLDSQEPIISILRKDRGVKSVQLTRIAPTVCDSVWLGQDRGDTQVNAYQLVQRATSFSPGPATVEFRGGSSVVRARDTG